jgi:hypothetical protein
MERGRLARFVILPCGRDDKRSIVRKHLSSSEGDITAMTVGVTLLSPSKAGFAAV